MSITTIAVNENEWEGPRPKLAVMHPKLGTLTVYTGPMFSKKTTSLFAEVELALEKGQTIDFYKPVIDTRTDEEDIHTHDGISLVKTYGVKPLRVPLDYDFPPTGKDFVAIDEAQFFSDSIVQSVVDLMKRGVHVVVSGLDMDSFGKSFGPMPELMTIATHVHKLHGNCHFCSRPSTRTLRRETTLSQEVVVIGAEESYLPACLSCWDRCQTIQWWL